MRILSPLVSLALVGACSSSPTQPDGPLSGTPDGTLGGTPDGRPDGTSDGPITVAAFDKVEGWSVRKRFRSPAGDDLVLEEKLAGFVEAAPGLARVRIPGTDRSWSAPDTLYLSDACRHPSGAVSGVLVGEDRFVSLVRLDPDLAPLAVVPFHDPDIAGDPTLPGQEVPSDLQTGGLTFDSARMVCVGEDILFVVDSESSSVIVYRTSFVDGAWAPARRTLVEPSTGQLLLLPTGGTFDTFEAMTVTQRSFIDVDEDGDAYIATYAQRGRIRAHVALFHDGLVPIPDPQPNADILLTQLDAVGARQWSRVLGTAHEDEPYAIRAGNGQVAVVGRSRRAPGMDNTFWDALIAVTARNGDPIGTRTIPLDASGILLAVDALPEGGWVVGGSDGWSQNPDGLSVLTFGTKLLLELPALDAAPRRIDLPAGPRHNEVRSVIAGPAALWMGGQEDGPVMHTGDGDPSQIHATGIIGVVPR